MLRGQTAATTPGRISHETRLGLLGLFSRCCPLSYCTTVCPVAPPGTPPPVFKPLPVLPM
jgi:hypothetical protein